MRVSAKSKWLRNGGTAPCFFRPPVKCHDVNSVGIIMFTIKDTVSIDSIMFPVLPTGFGSGVYQIPIDAKSLIVKFSNF